MFREALKKLLPDIDLHSMKHSFTLTSSNVHPQTASTHSRNTMLALSHFEESLKNDALAAGALADRLDLSRVEEVLNALDQCEGQLLISGVGMFISYN